MDIIETIKKMTLEQKVKLLSGRGVANTSDISELGIESVYMTDGANGVRIWEGGAESTCYPTSSSLASTWNCELAKKIGEYLGDECIERNVNMLLSPGINIKRTPLCGRNFEYYSEDPYLTEMIATNFVDGVQSTGTSACVKHFAGYNSEYGALFGANSEIDERTMQELYLKAFAGVVKNSKPDAIMCGYNRLNGVFCSEHKELLTNILRNDWGYEGLSVSDWGSVHDRANSLIAGLNLEMPNTTEDRLAQITKALDSKKLTIGQVDSAVEKILEFIEKTRKRENKKAKYTAINRQKLAKEIADESITLLKNSDNILPIVQSKYKKILVVGELAEFPAYQGGGCAYVTKDNVATPLEEIRKHKDSDTIVDYVKGYETGKVLLDGHPLGEVVAKSTEADCVIFFCGNFYNVERETFNRLDITMQNNMMQLLDYVLRNNKNVIVVVQAGCAVDMQMFSNRAKAIVMQWYSGECGSISLADILFGDVNPSGKLSETFPVALSDVAFNNTLMRYDDTVLYSEGQFVGYRYFDEKNISPLYEFGYGLSYTRFEYSNMRVESINNEVIVKVTIKNVGECKGKEIVQLYVAPQQFPVSMPKKTLKKFAKIELDVSEEREVTFILSNEDFAVYCTALHKWHTYKGNYKLMIGASSRDIRQQENVYIQSEEIQ